METNFDLTQKNKYSLSIRFSSGGFTLWVYDESNQLLSSKQLTALMFSLSENEIIEMLVGEVETQLNYRSIRLICELDNYVFVPIPIFKPEEAKDYLHFQYNIAKYERVIFDELKAWNTVNVFSIPNTLKNALKHLFPDLAVEHHLSFFLTDKVISQNGNVLNIWVRPKMMDVVVSIKGNLTLINSYAYQTPEDFTYFTLNIFEQFMLDTETCEVKLFNVEKNSILRKYLQKYVKTVHC
jgi:hypothetical protein